MRQVIEVWEYIDEDYIVLLFRFHKFWSKEVYVSKHKRVDYKRIFHATPLRKLEDERKRVTPDRILGILVSRDRLISKGLLDVSEEEKVSETKT